MAKRALVIGAQTSELRYSENDARLMRCCLEEHGYEVCLPNPVKGEIQNQIDHFIVEESATTDTVIFYFSGHGLLLRGNLFLVLGDDSKSSNRIRANRITEALEDCPARKKLVILDCCHAGAVHVDWGHESSDFYRILTASKRIDKRSKEVDELQASFLTHRLYTALTEIPPEITDRKGKIRISELYRWLEAEAKRFNSESDSIQVPIPGLLGNEKANFEIASITISANIFPNIPLDGNLLEDNLAEGKTYSEESFQESLSRYSPYLPSELRIGILDEIMRTAWHTIVHRPYVAVKLLSSMSQHDQAIARILLPLCKLGCKERIESHELKDFFSSVTEVSASFDDEPSVSYSIIVSQMLKYIFYHQHDLLESDEVLEELETLSSRSDYFWSVFFTDIYYRYICGYLHISTKLLPIIERVHKAHIANCPDAPLARLKSFITSPYKYYREYPQVTFLKSICEIATNCQSELDCKWTLTAFMRTNSLYTTPDEEKTQMDSLLPVIQSFPASLASNSPWVIFRYLHAFLRSFSYTQNTNYLIEFEKGFVSWQHILVPPNRSHLQLEYAASLSLCLQFHGTDKLDDLSFGHLVAQGNANLLLESLLFSNELVTSTYRGNISLKHKGTILRWLNFYMQQIYRGYAKRLLEGNHTQLLHFPLTRKVYELRSPIYASVYKSLTRFIDSPVIYRALFYSRSTRVFASIRRSENIKLMLEYIEEAVKAGQYEIAVSANNIMHSLYSCFYYGEPEDRKVAKSLSDKVAEIVGIGKESFSPKIHWVYYAGIQYAESELEKLFASEVWEILHWTSRKIYQLVLRRGEDFSVTFHSDMLDIVANYKQEGSLFAAVAANELNHPELWNTMATTIFNCRTAEDIEELDKIAAFYSIAKCFARSRRNFDQKYCYNYIRCKALSYFAANICPSDFYVWDTIRYLRRKESSRFAYKEELVKPFFDLLNKHWNEISFDHQQLVNELFQKVNWVRKSFHLQ